jgi:hypothetical protein
VSSEARHPRDGAASSPEGEQGPRSTGPRLLHDWSVLGRDQRLAAIAAVLLFATMLLPWYQQNAVVSAAKSQPLVSRNLNAFAVFSFVEAAVLLVAIAVLVLLYQRAEGRRFQLPGGDGAVVFAAGIWTALLLVLRLFDKPGIAHNGVAANVGVQWGIFFALAAAGLLAYAGSRMRGHRRPPPPLLREDARARRSRRAAAETFGAGAGPSEGAAFDPGESPTALAPPPPSAAPAPGEADTALTPPRHAEEDLAADSAAERARYPPTPPARARQRASASANAEQLSFEDHPSAGE